MVGVYTPWKSANTTYLAAYPCSTLSSAVFILLLSTSPVFFILTEPFSQLVKNLPAMQETWVQSPGEGNGHPFQYSCLENPMDRGAWWASVHGVTKDSEQLSTQDHVFHTTHFYLVHLHDLLLPVLYCYLLPYLTEYI